MSAALAVNSLPGRAKLATSSPPDSKSGASSGTAIGSPYGLLVIWHSTQSPRPASARQTAGRTLDCDRSENGKGTRTTSPAASVTMPRPPPADSSRQPGLPRPARPPRPAPRPARPGPSPARDEVPQLAPVPTVELAPAHRLLPQLSGSWLTSTQIVSRAWNVRRMPLVLFST